ncbi:fasciclin domain-containing protein [Tamlana fucoidanivorans]|nr:fasciclin domain-containing protein [Tamlana fucoidanivorans]
MKASNFIKKTGLLVLSLFLLWSCNDDDDTPVIREFNIVELALTSPDLTSLVAALEKADLVATLQSGDYTVFAPTNEAFAAFLNAKGFASLEAVPNDVLRTILLNHVVVGGARANQLTTGYIETLAEEATTKNTINMFVNTSGGVKLNGVSDVITPNLVATNGVVHIVNAVIDLPTVVDFAVADPTFSILVQALTRDDLTFDYVAALSTMSGTAPAPFTVFAPTNDAFAMLLTELGASALSDIDEPTLKATLDLHAVSGANVLASGLSDNLTVTTLGGDITANVTGGATLTDSNGRVSNIIVTDVQAANGVIHVIDKVVLPKLPSTVVGIALDTPELSILVQALQAADGDLVSVLGGEGPYTILAPDNAAFQALLDSNPAWNSLADIDTAVLSQVLLNHVLPGKLMSTDLVGLGSGYASTEATGAGGNKMSIFFDASNGVKFNGVSTVKMADKEGTNGVIHIVDAVIGLPTIVDHAVANPGLSSLVSNLTMGGNTTFTDLLSTPGDFTVFAPTNDAFTAFSNPNSNALDAILLNHVVVGATAVSSGLTNTYVKTAATYGNTDNNLSLYINTDSGVTLNGIADVSKADIIASNGVIHTVDAVIDIPTVTTFAVADPTFSTLVTALTTLTPSTDFAGILSTANGTAPAPFTVFAPTNDAFAAITVPSDEGVLTNILQHHVIAGANVTSADLNNPGTTTAPSLEGDDLTITLPGTSPNIANLTDGSGNSDIGIIAVDVQAGNGVIHVINKVAIPNLTN